MRMNETNKGKILCAVLQDLRLIDLGIYNPTDYDNIEDAMNSDNIIVKSVAMIILSGNKSETQVYNEISNYLINNI